MDFREINPLWRRADPLTVRQAAALIAGFAPNAVRFNSSDAAWFESETGFTDSDGISWLKTAFAALVNAINTGKLPATIRRNARMQGYNEWPKAGEAVRALQDDDGSIKEGYEPAVIYREAPDWGKTTVAVPDLVAWLEAAGIRTGFFFPTATPMPPITLTRRIPAMRPSWRRRCGRQASDTGFDLWEDWSLQAESFNARDARDVWKSIRAGGKVTIGTLFHAAKANGWGDTGCRSRPTPEALAERRRIAAERAAKEEDGIDREWADTASRATAILKAAIEAQTDHPYLSRKRVSPVATLREIDAGAVARRAGTGPRNVCPMATARA